MKTMNNIEVVLHPESHPHRLDLLEETISKISLPEDQTFFRATIDLGRVIGEDHLVETNEGSDIAYIKRGNRAGQTRMVLNQEADPTSKVTIVCCVATDPEEYAGKWVVVTLFEGGQGMPEPWDRKCQNDETLYEASERFWATHALVPANDEEWAAARAEYRRLWLAIEP